jgi:hypothetical protein
MLKYNIILEEAFWEMAEFALLLGHSRVTGIRVGLVLALRKF